MMIVQMRARRVLNPRLVHSISHQHATSIRPAAFHIMNSGKLQFVAQPQQQQQRFYSTQESNDNSTEQQQTRAQQLFVEGNEAFKSNNLEAAVDRYTELLALIENNAEYNTYEVFSYVLMTRSEAYKKLGEFNKAILDLSDCIDKKEENDENMELYAAAYLSRAKLRVIKSDFKDAQTDCDKLTSLLEEHGEKFPFGVADQIQHQLDGLKVLIKNSKV